MPAGGVKTWTGVACEKLQEILVEAGVLNFIHKTVVEQVLQVTIIQRKNAFPIVVRH